MTSAARLRFITFSAFALLFALGCEAFITRIQASVLLTEASLPASEPIVLPHHPRKTVPSSPVFREVGKSAGIDYRWEIPGKRPLNILQTIGNGCAFLDYDNDGNLDILLVGPKLALYKGDGHGHFTDVTAAMGLDKLHGHFLGCAVGDYDNDGYDDLYISGYRTGLLLHNEAGKAFKDVTKEVGIKPQPWGTSAAFADLDGDGFLDLYICNYVHFDPKSDLILCREHGILTGCGPNDYDTARGVLYHNEHGHGFRDVTKEWRASSAQGRGLGVAFADFDGSGHVGFAVANDLVAGDLFHNVGRGKLKNVGALSGTALDPEGKKHAGMGVDWGDYDNDGKLDLFVTTFGYETKCLYHNEGGGTFSYRSDKANLDRPTLPYVGWGCKFFDADNDGWLDLIIANGHVEDNIGRLEEAAYRQPTLFLHNRGGANPTFEDATKKAGIGRLPAIVGRGLAVGDFDNDGRMDVLIVDSEGRPLLLHNETPTSSNSWIGFRLIGSERSSRDAYGARITVQAGGRKLMRVCRADGSYLSSSDSRVHFGLGSSPLQSVTIQWPDGLIERLPAVMPGRYITVREGNP